jgi:hypothetical protein
MKCVLLGLLAALSVQTGYSAPFQNLGFDAGTTNTSDIGYGLGGSDLVQGSGPIADLLPGWQLFAGADRSPTIGYNYTSARRSKRHAHQPGCFSILSVPVEGPYALLLDGGFPLSTVYSLHQQGDIPAGANI